jgi:hypothetical protein
MGCVNSPSNYRAHTPEPWALGGAGDGGVSARGLRATFVQLEAPIVVVVVSSQLPFAADSCFSQEVRLVAILGLFSLCGQVLELPDRSINAGWLPGAVDLIDGIELPTTERERNPVMPKRKDLLLEVARHELSDERSVKDGAR